MYCHIDDIIYLSNACMYVCMCIYIYILYSTFYILQYFITGVYLYFYLLIRGRRQKLLTSGGLFDVQVGWDPRIVNKLLCSDICTVQCAVVLLSNNSLNKMPDNLMGLMLFCESVFPRCPWRRHTVPVTRRSMIRTLQ